MVDSLRVALRLLPAVRPRITGSPPTCGVCSKISLSRIHTASEQSAVLVVKCHPQIITSEKTRTALPAPGLVRFARAVLAYVGAGLSAVTANQFSGPSILQAKELGLGGSQTIGPEEARGMWQRGSASRNIASEDATRSLKFHCPLPHIVSKVQADACHPLGQSYYWNNTWGSADVRFSTDPKLDSQWQFGSSPNRAKFCTRHNVPDDGISHHFSKPTGLQALAAESNSSVKCSPSFSDTISDFGNPSDLQLEWQFIVDPKPGREDPIGYRKEPENQVTFEEAVGNNEKEDAELSTSEMTKTCKIMTKQIDKKLPGNSLDIEIPIRSISEDSFLKKQTQAPKEVVVQDIGDHQDVGSLKSSVENHSHISHQLPMSISNTFLSNLDFHKTDKKDGDYIEALEGNLLTELLHGTDPSEFPNSELLTSAIPCGTSNPVTPEPPQFHRVSGTLPVPLVKPRCSARRMSTQSTDRNTSWDGVSKSSSADRGHGLLGEALCHSQTRAREAEKKVQQVSEERERLVRLIFREASRSLTYRQCAVSLQVENVWLKRCASNKSLVWLHRNLLSPFSTVENMYSSHWKVLGQHYAIRQMHQDVLNMHCKDGADMRVSDPNNIMMGCTLGLAFALGLSLAGAGLVLGWSMGWILLAYPVSM